MTTATTARPVPAYAYGPAYRAGISPWPELTLPPAPMTPERPRKPAAPVRELYRLSTARRPRPTLAARLMAFLW